MIPGINRRQVPHLLDGFSTKEIYTLIAALLLFVFSGGFLITQVFSQRGPGPHAGGELAEGLVGQPRFINPVLSAASNVDADLSRIMFAQILKFDAEGKLAPDLAEALPTISSDQKTYTIKLKPGLKWHDGHALTSEDVEFTIQTIQDADFQSPLRPNWTRVKVEKVDELTLTIQLREVSASFINNFAVGIIPKHIWQGLASNNFRLSDANLKPVASGPYYVAEMKKTSTGTVRSLTLKPNRYYHLGRPYLNKVTFKFYDSYDTLLTAYQAREIDSLGFVPFDQKAFLSQNDNYSQYRMNLPQYQAVFFNLPKTPLLAEKAVRQALWLTVNREEIINQVYLGNSEPAFGPILPGSLGYNEAVAQASHLSLAEADGILSKAGWVKDASGVRVKNNKPLEFRLMVNDVPLNVKTAQLLQSQWGQLGAKVNLVVVGENELEQDYIRPRTYDALLFAENTGADPDPFPFWHSSQSHDPGLNFSGFNNANADKLLTEGRQTTDASARAQKYSEFQQIVNDQLPAVFLVRSIYIYHVPNKIQGISLTNLIQPSDRFTDIHKWYIQ